MSSTAEGPYTGTRDWTPDPGLNQGQVTSAVAKLRRVQDWKPLTVKRPGQSDEHFPPENPRRP